MVNHGCFRASARSLVCRNCYQLFFLQGFFMIPAFLAAIFYAVDPMLGLIVAIVSPAVLARDTDGSYGSVLVMVLFFGAIFFVRRVSIEEK